jgi:hypothetical protein
MKNLEIIICPHCSVKVQNNWYTTNAYDIIDYVINKEKKITEKRGSCIYYSSCKSCDKLTVRLVYGSLVYEQHLRGHKISHALTDTFIYPQVKSQISNESIPVNFLNDFNEAVKVLPISPKSSAALTRRILQGIFRDHYSISERTLDAEINKFINLSHIPSHLTDAVDAVRTIGNIAAHPTKDNNTGAIVDVEPGEAEWLIEVIEALFDFTFIQPKKLEERREQLNKKLKELGKPVLKSGN